MRVRVIGAGLAGCEAACRLAENGIDVELYEQKPMKMSPAHRSQGFAELVCSNSLKAERPDSAAGLLKMEMRRMGSVCIAAADKSRVPAGGALAVDRDRFSDIITTWIMNHDKIKIIHKEITEVPKEEYAVIATGPLTDGPLAEQIRRLCGDLLHFYDAAAPVITADSIDYDHAFAASRYGKGDDDYVNCPLNKEEYDAFLQALLSAERVILKEFEKREIYEGCMPVEIMAGRGPDTLRFGPLKPVGLTDPKTGRRPYAVVQLRKENAAGTLYNLVGFQTNLKFPEQKRVFSMIPALRNAEYARYGVMHRNTFIRSPGLLTPEGAFRHADRIYFAGQITGVEGYMESAMSGILAGENLQRRILGQAPLVLPGVTMMGALQRYVTDETVRDFQPMGANFGILPPIQPYIKGKQGRYRALTDRSMAYLTKMGYPNDEATT